LPGSRNVDKGHKPYNHFGVKTVVIAMSEQIFQPIW